MVEKLEFDMCIDLICISDEAQSLFASGKKTEQELRASFERLASSGAAVHVACETARRVFAGFAPKPPATPSAPGAAQHEGVDRRLAAEPSPPAPPTKRQRTGDGAPDDAHNPADKGADLLRRHDHFMSAAVDRTLYVKCSAEGQIFTPMLVHIRDLQRQVFEELAKVVDALVVLQDGDLMASPPGCILTAPRTPGAAITASTDDLRATLDNVIARLGGCHTACKDLQQIYAHAMRCYWLANHTDGANWETVRQIHFRDRHDQEQAKFSVGPVQEMSWDEKVALAMKRIDQNRGLSKDGVLLGPICPDIPRGGRAGQRPLAEHNGKGRGGGYTGGRGGRQTNRGRQNWRGGSDRGRDDRDHDDRGRDGRDDRNRRDDRDRRDNDRKDQGRGGDRSRTDAGSERP